MPELPSFDDFHPPYRLGAVGCVVLGIWDRVPSPPQSLGGFTPVSAFGKTLGVALVLRHERPPADYPVPYSEVISAYVVRRGVRWAAVAFDLLLDNAFHVEMGRRYYHLPKRLDRSMRLEVERDAQKRARRISASGDDVVFEADLGPVALRAATSPMASVFHALTKHGLVIGASPLPPIAAPIPVAPDPSSASGARVRRCTIVGSTLTPLYAQFWDALEVTVEAPRPLG